MSGTYTSLFGKERGAVEGYLVGYLPSDPGDPSSVSDQMFSDGDLVSDVGTLIDPDADQAENEAAGQGLAAEIQTAFEDLTAAEQYLADKLAAATDAEASFNQANADFVAWQEQRMNEADVEGTEADATAYQETLQAASAVLDLARQEVVDAGSVWDQAAQRLVDLQAGQLQILTAWEQDQQPIDAMQSEFELFAAQQGFIDNALETPTPA